MYIRGRILAKYINLAYQKNNATGGRIEGAEGKKLLRNTKPRPQKSHSLFFKYGIKTMRENGKEGIQSIECRSDGTVITIFMQPYLRVINLTKNF